jgi:hypothetical protein
MAENYIKKLQRENEEACRRLKVLEEQCQEFRAFLLTPKFVGVDADGERKDWISTSDVDAMLQKLHSTAMVG